MIAGRSLFLQSFCCFLVLVFTASAQSRANQTSETTPSTKLAPSSEIKAPELPLTNDPREIVRRSVEADHRANELARSYTCQQREVEKKLGNHGEVKSTEIR